MPEEPNNCKIKPMVFLPPGAMKSEDLDRLRENGICVVECENPDQIRFVEPPPGGYDKIEDAAIELTRVMLHSKGTNNSGDIARAYVDIITRGTRIDRPEAPAAAHRAKR